MAQMYPSRIPSYVRNNPLRAAECKTYDAFESQLDDSFHVFYSSPWIGTSRTGEEIDGEADFTIAHAQLGMLVIEVKGGRINIEQGSRKWTSTDRNGITFNIKDPVNQAMKGKHHLITKMKERPEWDSVFINVRHGVVLPDVKEPPRDLGASMPLRIFAFASDMYSLSDWVRHRFGDFDDPTEETRVKPLGQNGIRALKALVSDGITFSIDLRTYLDDDINAIETLTEQQFWMLEAMAANSPMAISGAAGTGKTLLAAQQAITLASRGKRVLLVCFNAPLATFLKARLGETQGLTIESFHQLVKTAAQQSGLSNSPSARSSQTDIGDLFIDALEASPSLRFDAIIVDEGQDFTNKWLESLEFALIDSVTSTYHVFYDSNQDVQNKSGNYIQNMGAFKYPLTRNFRNTKNIFGLSKRFYEGPNIIAIGPTGVPIEWVPVKFGTRSKAALKIWLGNLLKEERISPDRIAILCKNRDTVEILAPDQKLGKFEVTSATTREEGKIVLDSIRRFKGLESDIVVIYQPQKYLDDIELLYVATSRARAKLAIVGNDDALAFLKQQ